MELRHRIVQAVARLPVLASRHAKLVLALYLVASAGMVAGVTQLSFQDNIIDLLPEDNPHTVSARNKSEEFPQQAYVTPINLVIDPGKWPEANEELPHRRTAPRPMNVTDEVYVRGVAEFNAFMLQHVDAARYNISIDTYVSLINYTNTGRCAWSDAGACVERPDPEAFRLPPTTPEGEARYRQNWETFMNVAPGAVHALVGPGWNATRTTLMFTPAPGTSSAELGHDIIRGFRAYKAWAPEHATWDVFDLQESHIGLSIPAIDAHSSQLAREDVNRLAPLAGAFILAALYLAFRNLRSIAVAGVGLGIGALWSFGIMGFARIPLNTVNLALVPLILGDGIDYGIHVINAYLAGRSGGLTDEAAFREAGREAGVPLLIATATTVSGLLVLLASPSPLMGQVGIVFAIGVTTVFLVSLTFVPAALTLAGTGGLDTAFRPSRLLPALTRRIARRPTLVVAALLLVTAGAIISGTHVETLMFGSPSVNFPEGDWMRENIEKENLYMRGVEDTDTEYAASFLNLEGDVTDPAFHAYLRNATRELEATPLVRENSTLGIDFVISTWQLLEGGTTGAAVPLLQEETDPGSTYPDTREGIEATLDEIFASPLSTYASLFMNHPDHDITVVLMELRSPSTLEETEALWTELWSTLDTINEAEGKPDDVTVRMTGTLTFSYLLATEELPWVWNMAVAGFAAVVLLVWFFTRDPRATFTVATLMGLTSVWWLGLLPLLGVELSMVLMLPMVFIMSIGTDYAVHLAWNLHEAPADEGDHVVSVSGKGVLFSAVTDGGAFLIFVGMQSLLMRDAMVATSTAILVTFACTFLVLPLLYRHRFAPRGCSPEAGSSPKAQVAADPRRSP